jgi:hypothetical protein
MRHREAVLASVAIQLAPDLTPKAILTVGIGLAHTVVKLLRVSCPGLGVWRSWPRANSTWRSSARPLAVASVMRVAPAVIAVAVKPERM